MDNIGDRIKYIRKKNNITQKEVTDAIGLGRSTLSDIENSKNAPSYETILALSDFFKVSIEWLLTGQDSNNGTDHILSPDEQHLISLYKKLSTTNKARIIERIETMLEIVENEEILYKTIPLVGRCAAGIPIEALPDYETVETTKLSADFALTIEGQSMEPTIEDGSIVFVRQTSQLEDGEIGIFQINTTSFSTDEEVTCKIYKRISQNRLQLISINPGYEPIDIDLTKHRCQILGKVIL